MINTYNELPLGKFLELQDIDYTSQDEIDIQMTIISILNDMDIEEVSDLPLTKYQELATATRFLTVKPQPLKSIPNKIKIGDKEFKVIKDVREMTAGQYIDYQTYLQQDKSDKQLPYILTCFLIPKGEKYGDSDIIELVELFKSHLSIITTLSLSAFFLKKWENLTKATLTFLGLKTKMMMWKEKNPETKMKMKEAIQKITTLKHLIGSGVGFPSQYK